MKNLDLTLPPGEPRRNQRPGAESGIRSVHGIDMELHDRLAHEVQSMRYLSRLRAFLAADPQP